MEGTTTRRADAVWRALASPRRRAVLELLRRGPRTTGGVAARFPLSRFAAMQHLRVLERAGLVRSERRGRERWHSLVPGALGGAVGGWLARVGGPGRAGPGTRGRPRLPGPGCRGATSA